MSREPAPPEDMTRAELAAVTGIEVPRRLALLSAADMVAAAAPPDYLIQGLMERDSFGVLFGAWGAGKSLVALDWAIRIALGLPIHGRFTKQGPVVYVIGEGLNGMRRRLAAWASANGEAVPVDLVFTDAPVPLADAACAMELHAEIARAAEAWGRAPAAIFIDTLARNFGPGDENSNADMGKHVLMVDRWLRIPFRAAVMEVHHPGHGEKDRGRGASALPAACDFEYSLTCVGPEIKLEPTKTKDMQPAPPLGYRIVTERLRLRGIDVESPVALEREIGPHEADVGADEPSAYQGVRRGEIWDDMLEVLRGLHRERGENLSAAGRDPAHARVTVREWKQACSSEGIISGAYARQDFFKGRKALQRTGQIVVDAGFCWPSTGAPEAARA